MAAVTVLWSTQLLAVTISGFPISGTRTLSELADEPGAALLFRAGLSIAAVLFLVFCAYLRERFVLGAAFTVAMVVGMIGQLIAGLVPLGDGGLATRVHVASALVLGASIPVLMWRFAADQPPGAWRRRSYQLFWLEAAACAAGIALSRQHVAALAEILPATAFHLWVLAVTVGPTGAWTSAGPAPRVLAPPGHGVRR